MTARGPDSRYVEQYGNTDRRFYNSQHSQSTPTSSPKNPLTQISSPSGDGYYLHTSRSNLPSSLEGSSGFAASGQSGPAPSFIPPAPTPPFVQSRDINVIDTAGGFYDPNRSYGQQLPDSGYGRGVYATPPGQAAHRHAEYDHDDFGGRLSPLHPDRAKDFAEQPFPDHTMASANPLNVAGTLANAFTGGPALGNTDGAEHNFKDSLAREACNVTPGVDDTPYILYALDALTGSVSSSPTGVGENSSHSSTSTGGDGRNVNYNVSNNTSHINNPTHPPRNIRNEGIDHYDHISPHNRGLKQTTAAFQAPTFLQSVYVANSGRHDPEGLRTQSYGGDDNRDVFYDPDTGNLGNQRNPGNMGSLANTRNTMNTSNTAAFLDTHHSHGPSQMNDHLNNTPTGRDLHSARNMHSQQRPSDRQGSNASSLSTLVHSDAMAGRPSLPTSQLKDSWIYLDKKQFSHQAQLVFPPPDFKPAILRLPSLGILIFLCLLMITGLMVSAIYSKVHKGLTGYSGSIYGGQYFVFRILPQILAAIVFLYVQYVALAIIRIRPFARMEASGHARPDNRTAAIFDRLYPRSFLWPQMLRVDPWQISVPLLIIWLMNFLVPVQSALYSVVLADGQWRWATVQGVAWTLVAFYVLLVAAIAITMAYWHSRQTGLIWDPRSIADFVALASHSRTTDDYRGSELLSTRGELQRALQRRTMDKLGYWAWRDGRTNETWHGIGTEEADEAWPYQHPSGQRQDTSVTPRWNEKRTASGDEADIEAQALSPHSEHVRYRYLPWCLRTSQVVGYVLIAFVLLLALFIVSFLPSTRIRAGFLPLVRVIPTGDAFSGGNFLYSFLPALLGQIMFLFFSSLDLSMRILQPWAALSANAGGVQPEASILADYAACLPLQSAWHALRNRHWRVAGLSLMGALFALLPALSGGLFLALTMSNGQVRMTPNMVLYGFVLALLVLYFLCLVALLPGRRGLRLPHAVTSIAEILSFCTSDDLMREPAFKNARSKETLCSQLGVGAHASARSRWIFATGTFGDDRRLGIHRVRRYTELTNRPSGRRPQMRV